MGTNERWVFLFVLGTLLFNWPILSIFHRSLPYYLFAAWGVFLGAMALANILHSRSRAE
jgi:hypothetical protein